MVVETEVREVWGKKIEFLLAVVNMFSIESAFAILYAKSVGYAQ